FPYTTLFRSSSTSRGLRISSPRMPMLFCNPWPRALVMMVAPVAPASRDAVSTRSVFSSSTNTTSNLKFMLRLRSLNGFQQCTHDVIHGHESQQLLVAGDQQALDAERNHQRRSMAHRQIFTHCQRWLFTGVVDIEQVNITVFCNHSFQYVRVGDDAPCIVRPLSFHHLLFQIMFFHQAERFAQLGKRRYALH